MIFDCNIPDHINVNTVHFCNYRCVYCHFHSKVLSNDKKRIKSPAFYLKNSDFRNELDILLPFYGNNNIEPTFAFTGMGEPCLNPEFGTILDTCGKNNLLFNVLTNLSSASTKYIEPMIDNGVKIIHTDLDAGTKNSYEQICPGAIFENTLANLEKTSSYIEKQKAQTQLNVNFIIIKENLDEILRFIDLMHDSGVSVVTVKMGAALEFKDSEMFFNQIHKQDILFKRIRQARNYARTKGIDFLTHRYLDFLIGIRKESIEDILASPPTCPAALNALWLNWVTMNEKEESILGNVGMYCHLRQKNKYRSFGNIFSDSLETIINHPVRRELHHEMTQHKYNDICSTCEYHYFYLIDILKQLQNKITVLLNEADIAINQKKPNSVINKCKQVIELDPHNSRAKEILQQTILITI